MQAHTSDLLSVYTIRTFSLLPFYSNALYTLCSKKNDDKIQITITTEHLIRINYPLSSFNYNLSGTKAANFNKIHHMVSEQQLFKKWNLKTEFSKMENLPISILTAGSLTNTGNDVMLVTFL